MSLKRQRRGFSVRGYGKATGGTEEWAEIGERVALDVVEGRVQVGELGEHGRLVDLGCRGVPGRRGRRLGPLSASLLLGPLLGLLVAISLELPEGGAPA